MRRSFVFAIAITLYSAVAVQAQVGMPGIQYTDTVAGGDGVQLYPYDQQDPWLHGYFQRYPAYGGFSSFRPYNYRHVFAQTQLAGTWGFLMACHTRNSSGTNIAAATLIKICIRRRCQKRLLRRSPLVSTQCHS